MSTSITLSNDAQVFFDTYISPDPTDPYGPFPQYDYVIAGTGSDTVKTDQGAVTVVGSSGVLTFIDDATSYRYSFGDDSASGGTGSLIVHSGPLGGTFTGGLAGGNIFVSNALAGTTDVMTGVAAGDEFFGTTGMVRDPPSPGNDVMNLGAGREIVVAGTGPTTVNGGTGGSAIFAGGGVDYVFGGSGAGNTVVGGAGTLNVAATMSDAVFGGTGNALVLGSASGNDSVIGGSGSLGYQGRGGNVLYAASTGQNKVEIGNGASLVFAGSGNTTLTGGMGSLQMVLGSGSSSITEGSGSALFDLAKGDGGGSAVIIGFKPGTDRLDLFGYTAADQHIVSSGGNSVLSLADGSKVEFVGIAKLGNSIIG